MKNHLQTLYKYNHWCNEQLIILIINQPKAYTKRTQILISHILNAHHIWNCRINGVGYIQGVWDALNIDELLKINQMNFDESMHILKKSDYEYLLKYKSMKGDTYTKRIKDILFHIPNHSTYHRGQLMSELKANSVKPISLDYIFYKQ